MVTKYKKIKLKDGTTRDEHRLIMERHIGRILKRNELVHHINGDGRDNNIKNLKIMTRKQHSLYHRQRGDLCIMTSEKAIKHYGRKPNNDGAYECPQCKKWKMPKEFRLDNRTSTKLSSACKICLRKKDKLYNKYKRKNVRIE